MGKIGKIENSDAYNYTIKFESDDELIIDNLAKQFNTSRDNIVFSAISLLYTINEENPNADKVIIENKYGKKISIPINIIHNG